LSEKELEQVGRLKAVALKHESVAPSLELDPRRSAVDAIAVYGDIGIPALIEVGEGADSNIQKCALDWIAKIKKESKEKAEQRRSSFGS
jgi:hypothetical protein